MDNDGGAPSSSRRRSLRSYRDSTRQSESSDSEPHRQSLRRNARTNGALNDSRTNTNQHPLQPSLDTSSSDPSSLTTETTNRPADPGSRSCASRRAVFVGTTRRRGGSSSAAASSRSAIPPLGHSSFGDENNVPQVPALSFVQDYVDEEGENAAPQDIPIPRPSSPSTFVASRPQLSPAAASYFEYLEDDFGVDYDRVVLKAPALWSSYDSSATSPLRNRAGLLKRSRDKYENVDEKDTKKTLQAKGAVAIMLYRNITADRQANDIWPNFRDSAKLPVSYQFLSITSSKGNRRRRPTKLPKNKGALPIHLGDDEGLADAPVGRPHWKLPVELVELIASYLNRDDIKSMRLVSRELNHYVSQVIFKTVVVPFNTEIYGMLGQEQKPDLKGKRKAKAGTTHGFTWKNANGDDVYNGHGLDVFRGFGRHILRYGMSFEVSEEALANPPQKCLTERHTSFWGSYDWPFEEYRRFDDVAGLESAADETPRMKTAFSELSRVRELALSLDSGLGWLNGPDRSIRARILQRPPEVFGTLQRIPDRRTQAQKELWEYIQACHCAANEDVKLATLCKLQVSTALSELHESSMAVEDQPEMPFLDRHVVQQATPHDAIDIQVPTSFEDPEALERFLSFQGSSGTGILFTSTIPPTDAGQIICPLIPSHLTKAQKEWLLETEWAQRAFLSSYMLSVIDNPITFAAVHTLNISRLSDRYISMLRRIDFWNALPNLSNVTMLVIPGWRTVTKDEAGFVDTPKINPASGIDSFFELVSGIVSRRRGIKKLTLGWVTGGENAEGLYARNKLILPAPLTSADKATHQDPAILQKALLQLPFVEHLTLRNCWVTPATLREFVTKHDAFKLKHLVLDSLSLTAILRLNQNVQQAAGNQQLAGWLGNLQQPAQQAPQGGQANNAMVNPANAIQFHIQALQQQIQALQAAGVPALQNQVAALQAATNNALNQSQNLGQGQHTPQLQQLQTLAGLFAHAQNLQLQQQHQVTFPPALPLPAPAHGAQAQPSALTALRARPRDGSWMSLIDILSPGPNLRDFGSEHSQADPERITALQSIEFISCGYAKLAFSSYDQSAIEVANGVAASSRNPAFSKRYSVLAPAMLSPKWSLLGEIVQDVDASELMALNAGWDLTTGWNDTEEAQAVEFDGLLPGGTGRFTGTTRAEDRMEEASASVQKCATLMERWLSLA